MELSTLQSFAAQGFNRVPLTRKVLADRETAVGTYAKFKAPYTFLFESLQGGEKWGRYSIIGLSCKTRIRVNQDQVVVESGDKIIEQHSLKDPLAFVEEYQQRFKVPEVKELPTFFGGLVGFFGYDCVRYVEPKLKKSTPPDELHTPDILLMLAENVLVFDNLASIIYIVTHIDSSTEDASELEKNLATAKLQLDSIEAHLNNLASTLPPLPVAKDEQAYRLREEDFKSDFDESSYGQVVDKVKEYALAGDIMQVVPSQRMRVPFKTEPLSLYRALRHLNPSPYMYFLDLDDFQIVGSSPEILARAEKGEVTVRPIAGTRRRGHTPEEDIALEKELLDDPKEIAEHLMLIDLGRNDVGRVAKIGSVEVTHQMIVERYSHVMHIVSNVIGKLQNNTSAMDVMRATLPAGTLSGAPKIRAMEIIDEVEPVKRGVYGGAIGYISWAGDMDTAIAIRTAVIKDKKLFVQAGGGVVADSIPRLEWKETMNKARAMFRAAALAQESTSVSPESTDLKNSEGGQA